MNDLNNSNGRITALVYKYLLQKMSEEERVELNQWVSASEQNQAQFNELVQRARLEGKLSEYSEVNSEGIWQKIAGKVPQLNIVIAASPRKYYIWTRLAIAASVISVITLSGWYFFSKSTYTNKEKKLSAVAVKNDVAPGGNKAVLTLADGTKIVLDNAQNGSLATQGSTAILKQQDQITYKQEKTSTTKEVLYNTISTPRGGQFHVILPDGSNVWLNAASSIHFPTQFTGKERKVEVNGEAYFEVAKDKTKPFKVSIDPSSKGDGSAEIEVLGTHFNVNAYADESYIKTTLLEGSIKFAANTDNQYASTKILTPGQQAVLNRGAEKVNVNTSDDAESSISWVKGVFHFERANLGNVMRQLSRWYDVDVKYIGSIPVKTFSGKVERNIPLSKLLSRLEEMSTTHFVIEGRIIKVGP